MINENILNFVNKDLDQALFHYQDNLKQNMIRNWTNLNTHVNDKFSKTVSNRPTWEEIIYTLGYLNFIKEVLLTWDITPQYSIDQIEKVCIKILSMLQELANDLLTEAELIENNPNFNSLSLKIGVILDSPNEVSEIELTRLELFYQNFFDLIATDLNNNEVIQKLYGYEKDHNQQRYEDHELLKEQLDSLNGKSKSSLDYTLSQWLSEHLTSNIG